MSKLLAFLALIVTFTTPLRAEEPVHDCRIHHIAIHATRRPEMLLLRAVYVGFDGAPLTQAGCPDQVPPTWGADRQIDFLGPFGFRVSMTGATGEVVTVTLATTQATLTDQDRLFFVERRFKF